MKVSGIDRMTSRQMCVVTLSQRESRISVAAYKPMPECGILILRANLTQQFQTFPTKFYCRDEFETSRCPIWIAAAAEASGISRCDLFPWPIR